MEPDKGDRLGLILSQPRTGGGLRRAAIALCGAALAVASPAAAADGAPPVPIAVPDLVYVDTSGEVRDQTQEHATRIRRFSDALRGDLARGGKFRIVTAQCGAAPCAADGEPSALLARARAAGAKLVLIGGVHKESTLIQWAKVQAVDVDADRIVFDKLLTFRGDTEEAWARAEAFVAREVDALAPPP
jgi:Protein of unknown function (DUF2380)